MKARLMGMVVFCFCVGTSFGIKLPDGTIVDGEQGRTYKSGKIESVKLNKPAFVKTPAGKLEFMDELFFHENGAFESGLMTKDHEIQTPLGKYTLKGYDENEPDIESSIIFC